jgi:hypothetical protein
LKRPVVVVSNISKKNRPIVKFLKTTKVKDPCSTIDGDTLESLMDEVDEVRNKKVWKMLQRELRARQDAGEAIFHAINSAQTNSDESESDVRLTMDSTVREYIQGFTKESQQDVIETIRDQFPRAEAMDVNLILDLNLYKDIIRLSGDSLDFMNRYHGDDIPLSESGSGSGSE